jgi:tRNA (guanine37-N1)-methyltransferase
MNFEILTLFPEMFTSVLDASILKRAQASGAIKVRVSNIRDFTTDKHHVTDDSPYGGGPGMVMKPEPIGAAMSEIEARYPDQKPLRVYLSPQGDVWNQRLAEEFSHEQVIILLCGHYEGIDERARELYIDREVSIGDYVLTGGELPAMVMLDSIARLVPGVVGNQESVQQDSFTADGLLDHPHYTRPEEFEGLRVPEVLLSGHHKKITEWRRLQAIERTLKRRPDLINRCIPSLSPAEQKLLRSLMQDDD